MTDENDQKVQAAVNALIRSGVTWGTHTDRWGDYEWQREFWTEVATVALTGAGAIPPVQRCQTCIHPEGYDRLSGPCPTCRGDGVISPGCTHCGQALPHAGSSWRESGACRRSEQTFSPERSTP